MRTLRIAEPSDAPAVREIYAPFIADTAVSFETEVPPAAEFERRIAKVLALAPWILCEDSGRVTGYAYASRHAERAAYQWSVDVSIYTGEGQRRSGLGRALYTSLFALLELQGFYAAHAGITLPNAASVGLHEALGFEPVGVYRKVGFKRGAWHDVGWWQLALREREGEPLPPVPFPEARRLPGFEQALAAGEALLAR